MKNTAYCDDCESIQNLSEDGYCLQCGKHYNNMPAGRRRDMEDRIYSEEEEQMSKDWASGKGFHP